VRARNPIVAGRKLGRSSNERAVICIHWTHIFMAMFDLIWALPRVKSFQLFCNSARGRAVGTRQSPRGLLRAQTNASIPNAGASSISNFQFPISDWVSDLRLSTSSKVFFCFQFSRQCRRRSGGQAVYSLQFSGTLSRSVIQSSQLFRYHF
jgi:hypothetical protein